MYTINQNVHLDISQAATPFYSFSSTLSSLQVWQTLFSHSQIAVFVILRLILALGKTCVAADTFGIVCHTILNTYLAFLSLSASYLAEAFTLAFSTLGGASPVTKGAKTACCHGDRYANFIHDCRRWESADGNNDVRDWFAVSCLCNRLDLWLALSVFTPCQCSVCTGVPLY
jgi:hypothetical protein